MGIFSSQQKNQPYVPPLGGGDDDPQGPTSRVGPTLLGGLPPDGQPRDLGQDPDPAATQRRPRTAVAANLPGQAETTYLDSEFAPKVNDFIKFAKEDGISLNFSSAYRSQEKQTQMFQNNEGKMPAKQSLHSAGLAVDVDGFDDLPAVTKLAIRRAAERAGLSWGGTFGDDRHFHLDPIPGQDRTKLIEDFAEQVRRAQMRR